MLDKLSGIEERFRAIEARLSSPDLYQDPAEAAKLLKEQKGAHTHCGGLPGLLPGAKNSRREPGACLR